MLIFSTGLFVGFIILVISADRFVTGTAAIARNFGISPLLIGLTIVGLGTSAPEILVAGFASWEGNPGLAIGNAIGSNIANIGLVLACTALVGSISVHSKLLSRELPILVFISIACFWAALGGNLDRTDGVLMLIGLIIFLAWLIRSAQKSRTADPFPQEIESEIPENIPTSTAILWFIVGLTGLLISSHLLVWAAVNIAQAFGVSDIVIGLTIVALGTSLPELAASITSVLKNEDDLAVGNIVGSNIYNLLAVYSIPALVAPGPLNPMVISRDFPWMIGFTMALFVFAYSKDGNGTITRWKGGMLLLCYFIYMALLYRQSVLT